MTFEHWTFPNAKLQDLHKKLCVQVFIFIVVFEKLSVYRGCQKNVPLHKRFFVTTTYAAIPYFGKKYEKRYKNHILLKPRILQFVFPENKL